MTKISDLRSRAVTYIADVVVSSAQNFEDVLLFRVFGGKKRGFYIDVGAGDPNWTSVTNWFYRIGWSGINIEANPIFLPIYSHWRPRDINLNLGISEKEGSAIFYRVNNWGLSSFNPSVQMLAADLGFTIEELSVQTKPLQAIVDECAFGKEIDFLKIDVEGGEASVIRSADWNRFRPAVICIEAVDPNSAQPSFQQWEPILRNAGYIFALFDGVNNYYVRRESEYLLSQFNVGVNCNDRYRRLEESDLQTSP